MNHSIERLRDGIQELINTHSNASKIYIIRSLFDLLDDAIKSRISIDMLVTYLNENHVIISKHYLKNTLLRIRRERGISPQKRSTQDLNVQPQIQNQNTTSNSSLMALETHTDKKALFDAAMKKHAVATNLSEKFLALGGEPSDIVDKPDSQIRHIYTRHKIKFNRLYDEFI